uniref:Polypyrimidine tract-binding protein homolog 3-like n=1 Tax=Crassostrea virginica TaxID=6565 RepID=A0A8B8EVU0_CRAVI|nr:polypyrimidine tract-binding protein homolog 3-like [Crassostrea virginica]
MVLCPGFQKNGRPCTNILEQKNKFCKMCGWKIDPEIFTKEAISCPNIPLNSDEICGTWIESSQMYCDQCGWEVNHDLFPSEQDIGNEDMVFNGQNSPPAETRKRHHGGSYRNFLKESLSCSQTQGEDILTSANSDNILSNVTSTSRTSRETHKGRILCFHDLDLEKITVDKLFNLFSMYGRVEIIKLFFHHKGSGLIQMGTEAQAASALRYLDRLHVLDRFMHLEYSRCPKIDTDDHCKWTKNFREGRMNRGGSSFNYTKTACAPSPVIHMANLRDGITEEDIVDVFSQYGNIIDLRIYVYGRSRGALLEYASVEQAVTAIMEMHNFVLPDNKRLIVSFSRFQSMKKASDNS